jgi:hypothetical protein
LDNVTQGNIINHLKDLEDEKNALLDYIEENMQKSPSKIEENKLLVKRL